MTKGKSSSSITWSVGLSSPVRRSTCKRPQARSPMTRPPKKPPNRSRANSSPACRSENDPVARIVRQHWNTTVPVTSLNRASPLSSASWRRPKRRSWVSAVTATASVDPMAPPSAQAAARGTAGKSACNVAPQAATMAKTSPTESDAMPQRFFHRAPESTWRDSLKCRGAMNRMSSNSGSMPHSNGVGTASASAAPRAICTSGSDSGGRNLSRMLEAMTAVSRNRISSKVSIYTNPGKPCWARAS